MSIWEAFGMGRHKGFSREAGLLLDEAVERLHQVLPPDRCMVLQTELAQIDL